jgi:hypothetical protein
MNVRKSISEVTPLEESPRILTEDNSVPKNIFGSTSASHWLKRLSEGSEEDIFSSIRLRKVESKMFFKVALEIARYLIWLPEGSQEKYEMRLAFILIAFEFTQRYEEMSVFDDRVNPNSYLVYEILKTYLDWLKYKEDISELRIQCVNSWQQRIDSDQHTYGQLTFRASSVARANQATLKDLIDYILVVDTKRYSSPARRKRSSEDAKGYQNHSLTPKFFSEGLRVPLSEVPEEVLVKLIRLQPSERRALFQLE